MHWIGPRRLCRFDSRFPIPDSRGSHLLPRMIARPHERARLDVPEPHLAADPPELAELLGRVVTVERQVVRRRSQILAECENVHVDVAEIAHHGHDLLDGLAESEDDPCLRRDVRRIGLGVPEDLHDTLVATARPRALVQPWDGFGVVVIDLWPRVEHGADAVHVPLEVRDQYLHRTPGNLLVNLPDRLGEDVRAEVREVVAVHGRDDRVLEPHLGYGCRDARRLAHVVLRRPAVRDRAIAAVPRTHVAEDHERRGAVLPTFADVGAMRLFAHRVEVQLAHQVPEPRVIRTAWSFHLEPRGLPLGERLGLVAPHDLVESLAHRL